MHYIKHIISLMAGRNNKKIPSSPLKIRNSFGKLLLLPLAKLNWNVLWTFFAFIVENLTLSSSQEFFEFLELYLAIRPPSHNNNKSYNIITSSNSRAKKQEKFKEHFNLTLSKTIKEIFQRNFIFKVDSKNSRELRHCQVLEQQNKKSSKNISISLAQGNE